ncbi:hypothetical protein [Streptomyces sp. NBC_01465]|uniref:hypothetical protein n=1 Tax=Streptomyces sp. NBC_01465 TaxID=2903878 RepID=UPI002E37E075|nr:hypothetical protein [Streptomyces sp. NBC_01465]
MKTARYVIVGALGAVLLTAAAGTASAKPTPEERENERRAEKVIAYFCGTPHHDDQFYREYHKAESMTTWVFSVNPADVARDRVSGHHSKPEAALGVESPALSDGMRDLMCRQPTKDEFLNAIDHYIGSKDDLKLLPKYQNNDAALKAFPGEKLTAYEVAITAEKARFKKNPAAAQAS